MTILLDSVILIDRRSGLQRREWTYKGVHVVTFLQREVFDGPQADHS